MTSTGPKVLGGTAIKPPERSGFEAFRYFFHDPEHGTFLGRTPKSWALITLFYIIYYTCLIAFWSVMLVIFLSTISSENPYYTASESLIGTSPGLGIRPKQPDASIDSSMIIFNKDSQQGSENVPGWGMWREQVNQFLVYYDSAGTEGEGRDCKSQGKTGAGDACHFDIHRELGVCGQTSVGNKTGNFGYDVGQPCLYFKLNRIYGVENEPFNDTEGLPEDMPESLKSHIKRQTDKEQVWVNCEGENAADQEAMDSSIGKKPKLKYYPASQGLPELYFPYMKQDHYESPIVAVQFMNPPIGQLLHVECRAWAKNIDYNRLDRIGMVHFELLVLDNQAAKEFEKSFS